MDRDRLNEIGERFIEAWNSQEVERVVGCYTDDVFYLDPNTRGPVESAEAMRHYLTKLFDSWQMHWAIKEIFPLSEIDAAAVLWHASFRTAGGEEVVEADGMDLIVIEGDRIKRNEVYFDRAVLAPLLATADATA